MLSLTPSNILRKSLLEPNLDEARLIGLFRLTDTLSETLQTNTVATVKLIAALMPHWREQKSGYMVVNSSISAWWEIAPGLGSYGASKGALDRKSTSYLPIK